jgi:hypothetical protein
MGCILAESLGASKALIKKISEDEGKKFFKDKRASFGAMDNALLKSLLNKEKITWEVEICGLQEHHSEFLFSVVVQIIMSISPNSAAVCFPQLLINTVILQYESFHRFLSIKISLRIIKKRVK